ncbi:MAG: AAA family ATPase [Flavobacteriales bacterium]|jgi:predicted ATPase|nr:AAA family ATPase [Flavobacteriales bacterium]
MVDIGGKYFIITGAPSTGKSSVVNELVRRGYVCHDEIARQVIKENQGKNNNLLPWVDMLAFSDEVYNRMLALLDTIEDDSFCFLDRSMVDLIGYMEFAGKEAPSRYGEGAKVAGYSKQVFYMPFWEGIFANDEQRKESVEEAMNIDKALRKAYTNLGFKLVEVPKGTIEERVDFILEVLK